MLTQDKLKPRTHYVVDHPDYGLIACRTGAILNPQGYIMTWGVESCGFSDSLKVIVEVDLRGEAIKAGYVPRRGAS